MEELRAIIVAFYVEITIGLIVALVLLVISNLIGQIRIAKIKEKYNLLVRGVKGLNMEELLIKTGQDMSDVNINIKNMQNNLDKI